MTGLFGMSMEMYIMPYMTFLSSRANSQQEEVIPSRFSSIYEDKSYMQIILAIYI